MYLSSIFWAVSCTLVHLENAYLCIHNGVIIILYAFDAMLASMRSIIETCIV